MRALLLSGGWACGDVGFGGAPRDPVAFGHRRDAGEGRRDVWWGGVRLRGTRGDPVRLEYSGFYVILRIRESDGGRWIASPDTPDAPPLGCGRSFFEAVWEALAPYDGMVGELTVPLRR